MPACGVQSLEQLVYINPPWVRLKQDVGHLLSAAFAEFAGLACMVLSASARCRVHGTSSSDISSYDKTITHYTVCCTLSWRAPSPW